MILTKELHEAYQRSYETVTHSFLSYLLDDRTTQAIFEAETSKKNGETIMKALSGSQSAFLNALHFTLQEETALGDLQSELYSKQYDASLNPSYYLSLQYNDENITILLGESFFTPFEGLTEKTFIENGKAIDSLFSALAKSITAAQCNITIEDLINALEEQQEETTLETTEPISTSMEEIFLNERLGDKSIMDEKDEKQEFNFSDELIRESASIPLQAEEEETEIMEDEDMTNHEFEVEEDSDSLEEENGKIENETDGEFTPIELLNQSIRELYKNADNVNRQIIKKLRAELFELEVAFELEEEEAPFKVLQFQQQLLSLQFNTVAELHTQVTMARNTLELLKVLD